MVTGQLSKDWAVQDVPLTHPPLCYTYMTLLAGASSDVVEVDLEVVPGRDARRCRPQTPVPRVGRVCFVAARATVCFRHDDDNGPAAMRHLKTTLAMNQQLMFTYGLLL